MERKNVVQRISMPLTELEKYYCERRKERFAQGIRLKHIRLRKTFYPIFARLLMVDRLFRKQTITVLGKQKKYKEQVIFACTHIGENDVENIYEVLHHSCWWFVGDPCILYQQISGLLVYMNGCILLETGDKEDRNIAYQRSVELLHGGGSLIIFPEGARNGSENLPVMPLFSGTARMAMETHTKIVPVAVEQYGKRFVVKMGMEIYPDHFDHPDELTQTLRDALATLKWEIWEREERMVRDRLPENCRERFREIFEQRIQPWNTPESVEQTRFHTKEELEQKDVLACWDRLIPRKENAFLLRKR